MIGLDSISKLREKVLLLVVKIVEYCKGLTKGNFFAISVDQEHVRNMLMQIAFRILDGLAPDDMMPIIKANMEMTDLQNFHLSEAF